MTLTEAQEEMRRRRSSESERLQESLPESLPLSLIEKLKSFQRAMTAEEVADLLNISRFTVLRKAKRHVIPSFRVGHVIRFDPRALASWLCTHGVR